MKKDIHQAATNPDIQNEKSSSVPANNSSINRRKFAEVAATTAVAFTILPRHVLGGKNYLAFSDKMTLGYIGIGTQGIREL